MFSGLLFRPRLAWFFAVALLAGGPGQASPSAPAVKSQLDPAAGGVAIFPPRTQEQWLWHVDAANPALATATALQWTLHYWDGREVQGQVPVAKPASASSTAPLAFSFTPQRLGWAKLSARLVDASGKTLLGDETTLVIGAADKTPHRAFRYGICAHSDWLKEDEYKLSMSMLGDLGVDLLRDGPEWSKVEPQEGQFSFVQMDRLVADAGAQGIELQPLFGFCTRWATTGNPGSGDWHQWANKMPRLDPWLTYVKTEVARYKHRIHYWEVWNEPDHIFWLDTPENYVLLFNQTAEAVKQVDPSAKVLNGGLTFIPTPQDAALRQALLTKGDRAHWDIFAYHSYMTLEQLFAKAQEVDAAVKRAGIAPMPRWVNESGAHTLVPDGERVQMLQLVKKIAVAPALDVGAFIWYDLRDDGAAADTTEHRFGITDYYYRPRPAYAAYQNLIRELSSRSYFASPHAGSQPAPTADGVWMAGYAGAASHRLVTWREGKGSFPAALSFPEGTTVQGVDDAMGNPVEFSRLGKYVVVPLSEEPVYVAFTGPAAYPEVNSFLHLPSVAAALPGRSSGFDIGIHNPNASPLQVSLSGALAGGGKELFNQAVQLSPGETRQVATQIAWPADVHDSGTIAVDVKFPADGTGFHATVPYEAARLIPHVSSAGAAAADPLKIVLNQRENVISLSEGLAQADRDWKGPADLSATASLSYDETALHLTIAVQDDAHSQEGDLLKLWQGDGVQLAIRLDDADLNYLQAEFALVPGKDPVTWVDKVPARGTITMGALPPEVARSITRDGTQTLYKIDLPWATLGSGGVPAGPFRLSFVVNDNDGTGRRQWLQLSAGIAQQQNPALFPLFLCK